MVSSRGPSGLSLIGYNADANFSTPYPLNDGSAHYIAITYDGGQLVTAYVDGQQIGTGLAGPFHTPLGFGLNIGGGYDGALNGTLDEVAIYPAALSATQINTHWRAGVAVGCPATFTSGYAGAG